MTGAAKLAETLVREHDLPDEGLASLIEQRDGESRRILGEAAGALAREIYGRKVFIRGLIEFTNYCKNDCLYCGIRRGNRKAERYRLAEGEILGCCEEGYRLGFRTFVLQGGEDPYFTDGRLCAVTAAIRERFPDCAITLSCGERSRESYRRLKEAGADRYLLRHETASKAHYQKLHPPEMSWDNRVQCLFTLRELGYQVGCGMMVGSPYQKTEDLVADLRFIQKLRPHMVGIGPFLAHKDTPFRGQENGTVELTLYLLSIIRLMNPYVLLPATTALGTAMAGGREEGILHGANVIMPNLSPPSARDKYMLYDNKLRSGAEAAENIAALRENLRKIGYEIAVDRGDSLVEG